jgi:hypothetical protein
MALYLPAPDELTGLLTRWVDVEVPEDLARSGEVS